MAKKSSIETPLAEITLRRYEKPENLNKRGVVKKLCLSLGLLQPGDSRDIIVEVFFVLLEARKGEKWLSSEEVRERAIELRKEANLPLFGVASSNIRRQLKRLRQLFLVEKIKNNYRITEFGSLSELFNEKISQFLLANITSRVKDYLKEADHL